MADDKTMLSLDAEINILSVAYTIYYELVPCPLSPEDFYKKFADNGAALSLDMRNILLTSSI